MRLLFRFTLVSILMFGIGVGFSGLLYAMEPVIGTLRAERNIWISSLLSILVFNVLPHQRWLRIGRYREDG
ncbi:hypothetical protein [Sphingomonas sp. PAMC 26621]|uniref:hypothetical protein n=1 Tax=Sphingomonas sp. PAMC 26621 TaxID=1112213 RepID=UPI000475036D|nr:hypothetical protein [Sphingomonas sp. PAMC 26621]